MAKHCQSSRYSPAFFDFLLKDGVGALQDVDPLGGDLTDDADYRVRTREGLPPDDALGQAKLLADGAHLVFEQQAAAASTSSKPIFSGQPADVVVTLDLGRLPGTAFDHVAVQGALHEELGVGELCAIPLRSSG